MTSSGVPPRSAAMSTTLRPMSSGCVGDSATASESKLTGSAPPRPCSSSHAARPPRGIAVRGDALVERAVHQLLERGRMLNVNGSRRFIWNVERPARHLRPHLDALGAGRGVGCHDLLVPRDSP